MDTILRIAYQGGTHGNFLRYCLDRFSRLTPEIKELPFTNLGTSHNPIEYSGAFKHYHPDTPDKTKLGFEEQLVKVLTPLIEEILREQNG